MTGLTRPSSTFKVIELKELKILEAMTIPGSPPGLNRFQNLW